jgi:hypothetical protein
VTRYVKESNEEDGVKLTAKCYTKGRERISEIVRRRKGKRDGRIFSKRGSNLRPN